tara:strand:+ start:1911 stop:2051 length:141 start_codon:yes stop_codon:yes gene_type:complete
MGSMEEWLEFMDFLAYLLPALAILFVLFSKCYLDGGLELFSWIFSD